MMQSVNSVYMLRVACTAFGLVVHLVLWVLYIFVAPVEDSKYCFEICSLSEM